MAGHSKWANIKHRKAAQDKNEQKFGLGLSRKLPSQQETVDPTWIATQVLD